ALGEWSAWSFSLKAVVRSLLDVGTALWLAFMALGVGLWFWRWLAPPDAGDLDALLFSMGLGFAAIGLLVLFLGLGGLLSQTILYGMALALTAVSLPTAVPFLRRIHWRQRPSRLVTLYLAVTLGLALTLALLPPTAWDSLSYHLRGPWLYLQAGRIYPGVDVFSLNNPFLLEMLFMMGMALRSDAVAQLVHFTFGLLLAGMVYTITTRSLQLSSGWTAVLLLFATPMFMLLAPWAYNDLALAFVTLGSLYAYLQWRQTGNWRWLLLSGLFSGLALSFKYTSFILPLLIGLLIIWQYRRKPAAMLKPLLLFGLSAAAVAIVWYVKNWLFTGNPVYPFVFDGRFWDEYRTLAHRNPGSGIGFDPLAILKVPYTLTLGIADVSGDGPTGPLFLLFLPLLLLYGLSRLGRKAPVAFHVLLLYASLHYGFWLLGVIFSANLWQGRLMLPAFAALCPVMAWILDDLSRFDHPQFSLRRFVNMALAFVIVLGLVSQLAAWWAANPLPYIAGSQPRAAWLERHMGNLYRASEEINAALPADAVVQFLWEPRTYYCLKDCRGDHILDKYAHMEFLYGDAASIAAALQEEGVTHLLIHEAGLKFLRDEATPWVLPVDEGEYQRFLAEYAVPVNSWGEGYALYELRP
ncbi:MAG TPA: phospholipid carrier-dependent glycosyltransferase, partial [Chloroflexi bacterium]|nr:phospholipid carrier-dependent glycosyltransferase [Chloroflexota bacterium]